MKTQKIKLATNVPLIGTVVAVTQWAGKKGWKAADGTVKDLPNQIELRGVWDGFAEGSVFLDLWAVEPLTELGLLRAQPGKDQYGQPRFTVLSERRVQILKAEIEGGRKETSFTWANGAVPVKTMQDLTGTAPWLPGSPTAPSGPSEPGSKDALLLELYDASLRHAINLVHALHSEPGSLVVFTGAEVAAMAATLFIARSRLV